MIRPGERERELSTHYVTGRLMTQSTWRRKTTLVGQDFTRDVFPLLFCRIREEMIVSCGQCGREAEGAEMDMQWKVHVIFLLRRYVRNDYMQKLSIERVVFTYLFCLLVILYS